MTTFYVENIQLIIGNVSIHLALYPHGLGRRLGCPSIVHNVNLSRAHKNGRLE